MAKSSRLRQQAVTLPGGPLAQPQTQQQPAQSAGTTSDAVIAQRMGNQAVKLAETLDQHREVLAALVAYSTAKRDTKVAPLNTMLVLQKVFTDARMSEWPIVDSGRTIKVYRDGQWHDEINNYPAKYKRPKQIIRQGRPVTNMVPADFFENVLAAMAHGKANRERKAHLEDANKEKPPTGTPEWALKMSRANRAMEIRRLNDEWRDHLRVLKDGVELYQKLAGIGRMKRSGEDTAAIKVSYATDGDKGGFMPVANPIILEDAKTAEREAFAPDQILAFNPSKAQADGGSLEDLRASVTKGSGRQQEGKAAYSTVEELMAAFVLIANTIDGVDDTSKALVAKFHKSLDAVSPERDGNVLLLRDLLIDLQSLYAPHARLGNTLNEARANASAKAEGTSPEAEQKANAAA